MPGADGLCSGQAHKEQVAAAGFTLVEVNRPSGKAQTNHTTYEAWPIAGPSYSNGAAFLVTSRQQYPNLEGHVKLRCPDSLSGMPVR